MQYVSFNHRAKSFFIAGSFFLLMTCTYQRVLSSQALPILTACTDYIAALNTKNELHNADDVAALVALMQEAEKINAQAQKRNQENVLDFLQRVREMAAEKQTKAQPVLQRKSFRALFACAILAGCFYLIYKGFFEKNTSMQKAEEQKMEVNEVSNDDRVVEEQVLAK